MNAPRAFASHLVKKSGTDSVSECAEAGLDVSDQLARSCKQGNHTESGATGAHPPHLMLTCTLDKACLSYQDEDCPPTVLCYPADHDKHS